VFEIIRFGAPARHSCPDVPPSRQGRPAGWRPLNRQTGIFYLTSGACNPSVLAGTPNVSLQYDGAGTYSIGSLTQISNANSTTQFTSFDALGRILASIQTTGSSSPSNFAYTYDLAGNLTSEKYPSGRLLNLQYDLANRPTQVQNNATSTNYASNVTYNPAGGMSSLNLANGISRTISVNPRWQPSEIKDTKSTTTLLDLAYSWDSSSFHNNGSLLKQTITTPNATFTQTYSYDLLNRIQTISDTAGSPTLTRTFNYDALGNTWLPPSGQSAGLPYNQLTPTAQSSYNSATNQLATAGGTFAYDGAGNMTTLGQYALSYDYENRPSADNKPSTAPRPPTSSTAQANASRKFSLLALPTTPTMPLANSRQNTQAPRPPPHAPHAI
jgi:YD repeat-containing protein